jgi:uncharacterized membrane protein YhaH (DUF805 family)
MNRKGNVFIELIFLLVFVVAIAMVALPMQDLVTELNTELQAEPDLNQGSKDIMQEVEDSYAPMVDTGFIMLVVFFWIAMLIGSYMIDTYPVFIIIFIFLIAITVILGAEFSNMYAEMGEEYQLNNFPMMTHFFNNIVIYLIVIGFSTSMVMFAKYKGVGGGGF